MGRLVFKTKTMLKYFQKTKEQEIEASANAIVSRLGLSDFSDLEKAQVLLRAKSKLKLRISEKIKIIDTDLDISKRAEKLLSL